ncbi:hypothetical protein SAMN05660464_0648 [Geodermatophilus dictyosporus]|uniref:Uncharacterized protein n=1 Tax=Geodermatophilus dictyosporus TaxID=1523247 RepID=A0A1I5JCQ9_9ACTN|nr:hypothetical protein SAMN05660464_0648 [Geodermatophilus dictyosporus]
MEILVSPYPGPGGGAPPEQDHAVVRGGGTVGGAQAAVPR